MKCPRTGTDLKTIEVDGVKVEISESCGGVWFDNYELQKFDEAHEDSGEKLIELTKNYKDDKLDLTPRIKCPHHTELPMVRRFFSAQRAIEIDRCPMCGGIWLDTGELEKIREFFPKESDREAVTEQLVSEAVESSDIDELLQESEDKLQKAKQFSNMFRWLCPSKYGK